MNTADATTTPVTEKAWEAIQGAYDLQVHVAPDVIERSDLLTDDGKRLQSAVAGEQGSFIDGHRVSELAVAHRLAVLHRDLA